MLEAATFDSVNPGICTKRDCDRTIEVEPDQDRGWCPTCGANTVASALILAGIIRGPRRRTFEPSASGLSIPARRRVNDAAPRPATGLAGRFLFRSAKSSAFPSTKFDALCIADGMRTRRRVDAHGERLLLHRPAYSSERPRPTWSTQWKPSTCRFTSRPQSSLPEHYSPFGHCNSWCGERSSTRQSPLIRNRNAATPKSERSRRNQWRKEQGGLARPAFFHGGMSPLRPGPRATILPVRPLLANMRRPPICQKSANEEIDSLLSY